MFSGPCLDSGAFCALTFGFSTRCQCPYTVPIGAYAAPW